jgi:hypothetical protein
MNSPAVRIARETRTQGPRTQFGNRADPAWTRASGRDFNDPWRGRSSRRYENACAATR